ncbi:MAG: thiamine pyrophosphate-dependent enzyme [Beijerinckiaceae bacterium]
MTATTASHDTFGKEAELAAFRAMLLIRRFEEKAGQLYGMGAIAGYCHLYIGQEAIATGMQMAMQPGDRSITSYRCHGHALAAGVAPDAVMAELTGRKAGLAGGKGGSMHLFAPDRNFFGGHGIVGAQAPLGAGLAFASLYRRDSAVTVAYFGDGAADQGQVSEAMNLAARFRLPLVFVIENNRADSADVIPLAQRGAGIGIPGETVDGTDVRAVHAAGLKVLAAARAGEGPRILEMQTLRYRGHSMAEPAKYKGREGEQRARDGRDPIDQSRKRLLEEWKVPEADLKAIDASVRVIVNAAAEFATSAAEPDASALFTHVTAA